MLGGISEAHAAIQLAMAERWPGMAHQWCQFHGVREASAPIAEQDRKLQVEMRKAMQQRVRRVRKQLEKQLQTATGAEQKQLEV